MDEVLESIRAGKLQIVNLAREIPDGIEVWSDVIFGQGGEKELRLDLYRPRAPTRSAPALVFIHGGSWRGGNRSVYRSYGMDFASRGYIVASVSYRLSHESHFPGAVEDVKCAIRWLRKNADVHHIDPDKIAVIGGSAGGHLALMAAYTSEIEEFEGTGGNAEISSRVQAVINLYGPTDLTTESAREQSAVVDFLGKSYEESPNSYLQASPVFHVTPDDPPTLILHGSLDDVVPIEQADMLASKLKEAGVPYLFDRLPGWPHTMDLSQVVNDRCQWFMDRFLKRYLPFSN